jgi:hypothetical protein
MMCPVSIYVNAQQFICEGWAIQLQIQAFKTLCPARTALPHITFEIHSIPKAHNVHMVD